MRNPLNININSFGLGISDNSLRAAKIKKEKSGLVLASFGRKEIGEEIIKNGKVKNEDLLASSVKDLLKKIKGEKIKTRHVAASLPEEKSFLHFIEMPRMNDEELKKAVIYEAENYIPLPLSEVYLDFQVISSLKANKGNLNVLIVAQPKKIIDPFVSSLKKAGLFPVFLEIEPTSIARSLIVQKEKGGSFLLIDIGQTKTSFIIFYEGLIRFTSSIFIPLKDFAKADRISSAEEKEPRVDGAETKEALLPVLDKIVEAAQKHLKYYDSYTSAGQNGKAENISKIIISGSNANLKNLPNLLSEKLQINTETGNPFANFSKGSQKISDSEALSYSTAFGLALQGFEL